MPTGKHMPLKSSSPTPSNTGSLGMGTKVVRYWEVLQRGGGNECLWATKAPWVRSTPAQYDKGNAPLRGCIGLLLILNIAYTTLHQIVDAEGCTLKHRQPRNQHSILTTLSSSLRCESAAEHHTAEQYSKTGKKNLQQDLRMIDWSWNTCQDFLIIPSLWTATLEIARTWVTSKVILASNVTSNITRSADSFSTVPSRINGIYCVWIVIVLVLLEFNLIPHRLHHILTPFRSRFRDSVTATLSPGDGTTAAKVEWSA